MKKENKKEDALEEAIFNPDFIIPYIFNSKIMLPTADKTNLLHLERKIKKKIIGQDEAISAICRAIKRNQAGFSDPNRPVGSFIFLGTSGVGKTALCKAIAEALYGDEKKLIKLDMSEYMERWDASKLIGSAPGYVGYEKGGILTNMVKQNPQAVLCLDEIEKAHPDIFNIFLQIMEDGVLTSSQGERVSFKDILIIMTSNVGSEAIIKKPLGFTGDYDEKADIKANVTDTLKKTFKPEFLNRIDEIITFNRLNQRDVLKICNIMLRKVKERGKSLDIKIDFDKSAVNEIARLGYDKEYGARPLRRVISTRIEDMLADKVLSGELKAGDDIRVVFKNKKFEIEDKTEILW